MSGTTLILTLNLPQMHSDSGQGCAELNEVLASSAALTSCSVVLSEGAQTQRCADFTPLVEPPYVSPSPGRRQPESELHWSSAEFRGKFRKVTTKCTSDILSFTSTTLGLFFLGVGNVTKWIYRLGYKESLRCSA